MKKTLLLLAVSAFATTAFAQTTPNKDRTDVGAAIHNTAEATGNEADKVGEKAKTVGHKIGKKTSMATHKIGTKVSHTFHKGKHKAESATDKAGNKLRTDSRQLEKKTE